MDSDLLRDLLEQAHRIALAAGQEILSAASSAPQMKTDGSPLTRADTSSPSSAPARRSIGLLTLWMARRSSFEGTESIPSTSLLWRPDA